MGLQERWSISSFSLNRIGQCTCQAGYAQLHGFALPHGAETARRCVKHSLLERPGPKGLSPLQAQGLFGSRMGRFSTFCVSKVERKKVSPSLYALSSQGASCRFSLLVVGIAEFTASSTACHSAVFSNLDW